MKSVKRAFSAPELNPNSKKPKKASSQSNTLLKYFHSDPGRGEKDVKPITRQLTLTEFFKNDVKVSTSLTVKPKIEIELPVIIDDDEAEMDNELVKAETTLKNAFDLLLGKYKTEESESVANDEPQTVDKSSRKCPFYKRIEGTQITVDAFSYGDIDNCNVYFLSHFHYDHYIGMTRHFNHRLICSKITANLVAKKIRVDPKYIQGYDLNEFVNVYDDDSVQVALIDANHCPGSVMFLFRIKKTGRYVLHTGDFRASDELIGNKFFQNIKIDTIHLDTTYLDSYYTFQPQSKVITAGVDLVLAELRSNPKTLILCGSYTIGKERIFIAIANALGAKVCVSRDKLNILNCLEDKQLNRMLTLDPHETNLHVVPMGMLNIKDLQTYLDTHTKYQKLIAIKPTGWTHKDGSEKTAGSNGISIEKRSKNVIIYGVEYSEHSSFDELKSCVTTLRPRRIIPTVNVGRKDQRDKMQAYFDQWLNTNSQSKLFS